jgi:hypothetical protein
MPLETFPLAIVHGVVRDALRLSAISYDAVKHLTLCRIEKRLPKLGLASYPHLPMTNVATTSASKVMDFSLTMPAGHNDKIVLQP